MTDRYFTAYSTARFVHVGNTLAGAGTTVGKRAWHTAVFVCTTWFAGAAAAVGGPVVLLPQWCNVSWRPGRRGVTGRGWWCYQARRPARPFHSPSFLLQRRLATLVQHRQFFSLNFIRKHLKMVSIVCIL